MNSFFENIKNIIARLFGRLTNKTAEESSEHGDDTARYEQTAGINITSIVANKLATLTIAESAPSVSGENQRAEILDGFLSSAWNDAQEITARAFGIGGCAIVPYVAGGKIYTDIIPKDRFFITKSNGTDIIGCTVIADVIIRNNKKYMRLTDYELEGSTYIIRNKAVMNDAPVALTILPEWEEIPEEIRIGGCDRILLAYLRSPYNKGRTDNLYGVPITRGSEEIIAQITECLVQIKNEYKNKKVKIFADSTLFDANDSLDAQLYRTTIGGSLNADMFTIFDPAIRDSAYYNRLEHLFALLEKSIGTSRGILTEAVSTGATATEIKRAAYDTFALVSSMRRQWEKAVRDLVNAFDVYCNAFAICPMGDYSIGWDWSDSLIESSAESWQMMREGKAEGVISARELRQYLMPHESAEEADEAIAEIKENEPSLRMLFGE